MRKLVLKISNKLFERISSNTGSRFRQNVLGLAKANVLTLALPFLAAPLLTRLYTPEDFAVLAVFLSLTTMLLSVVTFRFDYVLPNAKAHDQVASLFVAGMATLFLSLAIIVPVIVVFDLPESSYFALLSEVPHLAVVLPVTIFALACSNMLKGWFVWTGDLRPVSKSTIALAISNVGASICLGVLAFSVLGLVGAAALSAILGTIVLYRSAPLALRQALSKLNRDIFVTTERAFRKSAAICTLSSLCSAAALTAPVFLLVAVYPSREVGWFILMHKLIAAPLGALTSALGQGFWSHAAELVRTGSYAQLRADQLRATRKLALLSLPTVFFCLAGPLFVGPIFGEENWAGAGLVLVVMAPMFVGSLVFKPTNHLVVLNKKHMQIYADLISISGTIVSVGLAANLDLGFLTAVALLSVSFLVGDLFLFMAHRHAHRMHL